VPRGRGHPHGGELSGAGNLPQQGDGGACGVFLDPPPRAAGDLAEIGEDLLRGGQCGHLDRVCPPAAPPSATTTPDPVLVTTPITIAGLVAVMIAA
jgi:hypothetical protein